VRRILRRVRRFVRDMLGLRRTYRCDGCRKTSRERGQAVGTATAVLVFCPSCVLVGKADRAREAREGQGSGVLASVFGRHQAMNENFRRAYGGKERG
jgi:hypothetical protein